MVNLFDSVYNRGVSDKKDELIPQINKINLRIDCLLNIISELSEEKDESNKKIIEEALIKMAKVVKSQQEILNKLLEK